MTSSADRGAGPDRPGRQDRDALLARVAVIEDRIRDLVAARRAGDPAPDDPFRGLYLTEETIDRLLIPDPEPEHDFADSYPADAVRQDAPADGGYGEGDRLARLARSFGLVPLDVDLLMVALVPDLDSRFERLYGYLNDDVTRRRATIGLALTLLGVPATSIAARARLAPGCPLMDRALIEVEDDDRPFLTRCLRVPDRVTAHLLGGNAVEPRLSDVVGSIDDHPDDHCANRLDSEAGEEASRTGRHTDLVQRLAATMQAGQQLIYLRESLAGTGSALASAAATTAGRSVVHADLGRLARGGDPFGWVTLLGRETALRDAVLVAGPVEALATVAPDALRRLASQRVATVLVGSASWDPEWSARIPLLVDVVPPDTADRVGWWRRAIGPDLDLDPITGQFTLGPEQVRRAVHSARAIAELDGIGLSAEHLRRGARAQNAAGLERLAVRVEPEMRWADLVLPDTTMAMLRALAARARQRDKVLREWRMRPGGGRGRGVTALFAGESGTGKTMSAEVIAGELGLDMYTVNLATVVDKYVGETEKNLERIFTEASGVNAVLLFDEADAIFGKRGEVRDAHDRYANMESAYLLQRMETFDGLAILSTNLRANIDDAFTRRLDAIVDFPEPDEQARLALWRACLAPPLPCADDLDLEFCAKAFELSGGNIRSIALTAGYRAAASGAPVTMADLIAATAEEYRKLGRLVLTKEFGPHLVAAG
jgi:hypothetical protein